MTHRLALLLIALLPCLAPAQDNATSASSGKMLYVYPQTASGAVDLGTLINNAFAACGRKTCTVVIAPQNTLVPYSVPIQIPSAMGQWLDGSANTLGYTGGGDALIVQPMNSNDPSGGIRNLQFDGSGNTSATNVIHQFPRIAFRYDNVAIRNHTTANALLVENTTVRGTAQNGWPLGQTVKGYSERTRFEISSTNNRKGLVFRVNGGTNSFARSHIAAMCTLLANQACVSATDGAFVYGTVLNTSGNSNGPNTRFVEVTGGATIRAAGFLDGEGGGFGYYNEGSFFSFQGAVAFDTAQGNFSSAPSSRTSIESLQGQCFQAGYFNLGLPQERNMKYCLTQDGVDVYALRLGGERHGHIKVHTRATSGSNPEADTAAGRDTTFEADAAGVKVGSGFEDDHASLVGADLAVHGKTSLESKTGLNGTTYSTETIDEARHRFLRQHYGGTAAGQPSIPLVDQWYDFTTYGWIEGETAVANGGKLNRSLTGNQDAGSFSAHGAAGWSGTCTPPKATVVTNGIVTGCK